MIDIELRSGLGDGLIYLHESIAYEVIEQLGPDDRARVTIISHNPFVDEIFLWHPKAKQIEIVKSKFFFLNFEDSKTRISAGVSEQPPRLYDRRERLPIRFYPSPVDIDVIAKTLPKEPFLAIAPTASGMEIENRNIPESIVDRIVSLSRSKGIATVFLGRTYQGPHPRKEAPSRPGKTIDLTDRLSIPGTAEVIKRSRATVCAHSALLLLSWYERKPNFAMYPTKYKNVDFDNPSPFGFGKDYPETVRMLFGDFSDSKFEAFLDRNFGSTATVQSKPHPVFESWYAPGGQGSGPGSSPESTAGWRTFLQNFIRQNKIRSVVDFGCGDWQFSRLIDWGNATYHGVDVVPSLVSRLQETYSRKTVSFSCVDPNDPDLPNGDLLVTKDVLQHLPNETVKRLMERFRKFKSVVLVNDWVQSGANSDIELSGYRQLDFSKPPFSIDVSLLMDFGPPWGKRAYLWKPS